MAGQRPIDAVKGDPQLQKIIAELKQKKFLVKGTFDSQAYLRDTDRIESAWKEAKSRINAIAIGVSRYYDLFHSSALRSLATHSAEELLKKWRAELKKEFPLEHEKIDDSCSKIGRYLEYMNRKSQDFYSM